MHNLYIRTKFSLWNEDNASFFAARNKVAEKEEEKAKNSTSKGNTTNAVEYDVDDDEIDEFKEVMMQLEPKYRRYANWRIWMLFETVYHSFRRSLMQNRCMLDSKNCWFCGHLQSYILRILGFKNLWYYRLSVDFLILPRFCA